MKLDLVEERVRGWIYLITGLFNSCVFTVYFWLSDRGYLVHLGWWRQVIYIIALLLSMGVALLSSGRILNSKLKGKTSTLELILDSIGRDACAAFKIVKVLRKFCENFNVIVPVKAKSAATLVALGSDKIFMTRIAELGPIDPMVSHPLMTRVMIPARIVQNFIDNVLPAILEKYGPQVSEYFLKIDYNHVGFCRMAIEEARYYTEQLLKKYHLKRQARQNIRNLRSAYKFSIT